MSQWTHVAGMIRVDGMGPIIGMSPEDEEKEIRRILGHTCHFNSPREDWDKCSVPCGSEGSIQYEVSIHSSKNSLYRGAVTIWGDLRNYDEDASIGKWFKGVLEELTFNAETRNPFSIRDAILSIDVEGSPNKVILTWSGNKVVKTKVKQEE